MRLGRIYGINIKMHISAIIVAFLAAFNAGSIFLNLIRNISPISLTIVSTLSGFAILFSILIHELMHSIVSIKNEIHVKEIELYLFGGIAKISEEPHSPKTEFKIAIAGPLTSLGFGALLIFLSIITSNWIVPALFFAYNGWINISLGLFNLIPAFPMDGGRILRAFLWKRSGDMANATRKASLVGRAFGNLFIIFGFIEMIFASFISGLWLIFIGNFLNNAAMNAYIQTLYMNNLEEIHTGQIMHNLYPVIPADLSIDDVYNFYIARFPNKHYVVSNGFDLIGIIHAEKIYKLIQNNSNRYIKVFQIMDPIKKAPYVYSESNARKAFKKLMSNKNGVDYLIVKDIISDDIVGIVDIDCFRNNIIQKVNV
ncbi:MAG: site-2 protease family protein [Promethearchaeota archaeon]